MTIQVILLGIAQDAGVPQAGCTCATCKAAQADPRKKKYVVSLGIIDKASKAFYMVDATPDFREQHYIMQSYAKGCAFSGVFLTHAHIGHYTGLMHVGKEAMHTKKLPVFASQRMSKFLKTNAPWNQLVEIGNIRMIEIAVEQVISLSPKLTIAPVAIPHRSEYTDTLGFIVSGPKKKLLYVPDIDSWHKVEFDLHAFFGNIDIALVDGSFFSGSELPGRDMSKIPHPTIQESVELFQRLDTEIQFIHLNHTNPLWGEGKESAWLEEQGFKVAPQGQKWEI